LFAGWASPWVAVAVWSVGMGGQYSMLRALVPEFVEAGLRGRAFGWFNTVFGLCWFGGSAAMGVLYGRGPMGVVGLAVGAQLAAMPLVVVLERYRRLAKMA
jgi:hypothetical protein